MSEGANRSAAHHGGDSGKEGAAPSPPPLWGRDRVGGNPEPQMSGIPPPSAPPHKGEGSPRVPARHSPFARLLDSDLFYSFTRSKLAMAAALVTVLIVGAALLAPWIAPQDPYDLKTLSLLDANTPPAWENGGDSRFLLGTDDQGRDILSTILYGTRSSLIIGVAAVLLATVLGVALGLWAGYAGGRIDAFVMRAADVQLTFPAILTALLIDGVMLAERGDDRRGNPRREENRSQRLQPSGHGPGSSRSGCSGRRVR